LFRSTFRSSLHDLLQGLFRARSLSLGTLALALGGCAIAPEIPVINRLTQPQVVTETIYVPIYVEVEKVVPAAPPPAPTPAKLPEEYDQTLSLLSEVARASNGNAEESRKELAAAQAAFNKDRSAANRMRLALYTAMTATSVADENRLQGLLEPLVAKVGGLPVSHPLRPVAEALLFQVNERNRQVRDQTKKVDELQQKLDALKAIEKQLLDRDRRRN
jgi:hypothetical protein